MKTKENRRAVKNKKRKFVMCPPLFYNVAYNINDWTSKTIEENQQVDVSNAVLQWLQIYGYYKERGIEVELVNPEPGLDEFTFVGDSIFLMKRQAIISNYKNKCRSNEAIAAQKWAQQQGYEIRRLPDDVVFEGNAMCIKWNNKLLLGFGERTSKKAAQYLHEWLNVEVIPLELNWPYFHFDVALFPLDEHTLVVHKQAFTTESFAIINKMATVVEVTQEEANTLACNTMVVDNDVLFSCNCMNDLGKKVAFLGYQPKVFSTSEFLKVGGGIKCLTLEEY